MNDGRKNEKSLYVPAITTDSKYKVRQSVPVFV